MTIVLNGDSGITTPTYGGADTSEYLVPVTQFKNRIINGAMTIDQRNAGTVTVNSSGLYTVDRWQANQTSAGKFSVGKSTVAPTGFVNSYLATSLSAYSVSSTDIFFFQQNIEGNNIADFGWGTASAVSVTLSFWVRSSLTGTFGGCLANSAHNRSYPFSYTISSANTWEQKSITIAGDTTGTWATDNTTGMQVIFGLGGGSTRSGTAGSWQAATLYTATGATSVVGTNGATFYITGVQLEVGSTATSFDYRPYGTELALCQRYCYVTGGSAYSNFFSGFFNTTTDFQGPVVMPVTMRSSPTLTTTGSFQVISNSAFSASSLSLGASETTQMTAKINGIVSGATAGYGGTMRANNDTTAKLILSAEL